MSFLSVLALLIAASATPTSSAAADDPRELLARAEALYYQADFAKSIELLSRADELLQNETGRMTEKTAVKLQLALSFIGLKDRSRAKKYLQELYALDSRYEIDPQLFSTKVIQLAQEAKAEQDELDRKAADVFFKQGLEAYKKGQLHEGLEKFYAALRVEPKHELATQYIDLTKSKLEVAADRALVNWRKDFIAGEFALAARDYRELLPQSSLDTIAEVHREYRRALSDLVEWWNRGCSNNDAASMEEARRRINELLPEQSFAEDLLAKMKNCSPAGCIQMTTAVALSRLRSRVDPQFPLNVISQLKGAQMTVHVKARISEDGRVTAIEPRDGNPTLHAPIRTAMDQWKFMPAISQGAARCVVAEIPIVINFNTSR
jgi:hypothetical protein